jgi:hypothetical protein
VDKESQFKSGALRLEDSLFQEKLLHLVICKASVSLFIHFSFGIFRFGHAMTTYSAIYDTVNWSRVGRGKGMQFFATDDEVAAWLQRSLPCEYTPYSLGGVDLVQNGSIYDEIPFEFAIHDFPECMNRPGGYRYNFSIISRKLHPDIELQSKRNINAICTINGFPLMQHGVPLKEKRDRTFFAITPKVINIITGETREYPEYLRIFNTLAKTIRKSLVYTSIHRFPDGHEEENRDQLMTEQAAISHGNGYPFIDRPGTRV